MINRMVMTHEFRLWGRKYKQNHFLSKAHTFLKQFMENMTELSITNACFDFHAIPKAFSLLT